MIFTSVRLQILDFLFLKFSNSFFKIYWFTNLKAEIWIYCNITRLEFSAEGKQKHRTLHFWWHHFDLPLIRTINGGTGDGTKEKRRFPGVIICAWPLLLKNKLFSHVHEIL
uniref:Uncharacterized protein n=1 Tax=Rhizophagus irregularis (strain DAOM 181602 / DAOM 197198 / MUCL 43194) TaxID=747089 RepID=U9TAN2_RHIID